MSLVVLGAGRKAEHLCDLFGLWMRLRQFYEQPRVEDETKREIPVTRILEPNEGLDFVISAVGDTRHKRSLLEYFEATAVDADFRYHYGELVHPTSTITYSDVGKDFVAREYVSIGSGCRIGDHVSVGPLANISHHSKLGDYTTICGQVAMSGGVTVGEGVFIGQGASIKPDIVIGDGAVIGTGAAVVHDVPPDTVVAGNPAAPSPKFKSVEKWSPESS